MTNAIDSVLEQMRRCASGKGVLSGRVVSIWADTLERVQQQTEPTDANGASSEVNRSVSRTAHRAGFAELRARVVQLREEAWQKEYVQREKPSIKWAMHYHGRYVAFQEVLHALDAIEADAKDACTRREEPDFDGPSG